jgi:hypothetical protein
VTLRQAVFVTGLAMFAVLGGTALRIAFNLP